MSRLVRRGECNRCGRCCDMSIVNPTSWKNLQAGAAEHLKNASIAMGERVVMNPRCAHLLSECPHCGRILSTNPAGWDCSRCAVTVLEPRTTRCAIHDKRQPRGCVLFPHTPRQLYILNYRLKQMGRPLCSYTFEEVVPRHELRKRKDTT